MMEEILKLLSDLSVSDNPLETLHTMKESLHPLQNKESVKEFEKNYSLLPLNPLFDVLNTNNRNQLQICIEILTFILASVDPLIALEQFHEHYLRGLLHPDSCVQLLMMNQIFACSTCTAASSRLLEMDKILVEVTRCLGHDVIEISSMVEKILFVLCKDNVLILKKLFSEDQLEVCSEVMNNSHKGKFNIYSLVVKISSISSCHLEVMFSCGLMSKLVNEINNPDPLAQLAALEMLSEISTTDYGLRLLQKERIVEKLTANLNQDDPMGQLVIPGVLKFFGRLGAVDPHFLIEKDQVSGACPIKSIMKIATNPEDASQMLALETLAHIAFSLEGKEALAKCGSEIGSLLEISSEILSTCASDVKVRILDSAAKIFYIPADEVISEDLLMQIETWLWKHFAQNSSIFLIVKFSKLPFEDVSVAALQLLLSISHITSSLNKIINEPGFMEWLLDRNSAPTPVVRNAKWELVGEIGNTTLTGCSLTAEQRDALQHFYGDGPHFKPAENAIMAEEGQ